MIIVFVHIHYVSFMPVYDGQDGLSHTPVNWFTSVSRDVKLDNKFFEFVVE